jgi:HAD superfamily hydrolase (TIGR01484 family)
MKDRVSVIFSDYDGTLCPTTSVKKSHGNNKNNVAKIPQKLEKILYKISKKIPICIISSKDFVFLHNKTKFAHVLACVLGIETLVHKYHHNRIDNLDCVIMQHLATSKQSLLDNSKVLSSVSELLQKNYNDATNIIIERKYTIDKGILIGLTVDYRQLENWQSFKEKVEPGLREMIQRNIQAYLPESSSSSSFSSIDIPFIQTYATHPLIDVYAIRYDKGIAFDNILSKLNQNERPANVLYLGDSENDNCAFTKTDISIGIRSDYRLNAKLDCKYMLDFNELPLFLDNLIGSDFIFSEDLLPNL